MRHKYFILAEFPGLLHRSGGNYIKSSLERRQFTVVVNADGELRDLAGYHHLHYEKLFTNLNNKLKVTADMLITRSELDSHTESMSRALEKHWDNTYMDKIWAASTRQLRFEIYNAQPQKRLPGEFMQGS